MLRPLRLLVVDDSAIDCELIVGVLSTAFERVEIVCVDNPLLARGVCESEPIDCVITDYNMPGIDGVSLVVELRDLRAHLPIILLTSVGDEMLAADALRRGATDYLPKSRVSMESLRRAVERSVQSCGQARLIDEQRQRLESFAYALAHDFKQPVRQIGIFSQLIAEELRPDAGVQKHLRFLSDAARRLAQLVDVMIQYTLLNQPPDLAETDLCRVLEGISESLAPLLIERGAELILPSEAPLVHGNEALMTMVLQNLLINGVHYNVSDVPRVELTTEISGGECIIRVSDNGIGIEPEYVDQIFKPLFRLHSASEYAGTGLGLTLARTAMLAQDGSLSCESTLGVGSTFYARIPTRSPAQTSKPQ